MLIKLGATDCILISVAVLSCLTALLPLTSLLSNLSSLIIHCIVHQWLTTTGPSKKSDGEKYITGCFSVHLYVTNFSSSSNQLKWTPHTHFTQEVQLNAIKPQGGYGECKLVIFTQRHITQDARCMVQLSSLEPVCQNILLNLTIHYQHDYTLAQITSYIIHISPGLFYYTLILN